MGVDGLETDGLGKLSVSREGMMKRNRYVFEIMLENRIPTVVFMGGGYSKPIEHTDAFYDLFTDAAEWTTLEIINFQIWKNFKIWLSV